MEENNINNLEQDIFEAVKEKFKDLSPKEAKKIIEGEVRKRNYLSEDWQINYAVERIKEMLDKHVKEEIRPLNFKEEMNHLASRIIFIITTLWLVFSGMMILFDFLGKIKISGRIMPIFLFSFIGGISFLIKQIFNEENSKNGK